MKKNPLLSSAGTQLVRDALGGRLMLCFVIACGMYYALMIVSNMTGGNDLILSLILILAQGFVTAESMILYQRKESRNAKHLSVFCLIGMIVLFLIFLFLGAVVLTLNMEYSAKTEEILQLWADADLSSGMPYMIATVASVGLGGLTMLFLWKVLGMSAVLMEHKGTLKNWFLPAAVMLALYTAMNLALTILQPGNALNIAVALVSIVRDGLLTALLAQTAMRCRAMLG